MANYTPKPKTTGEQLTAEDWSAASAEIEEQENYDAAQDATIAGKVSSSTRTSDLATQDSRDDAQEAARTSDLATQDSRDDAQDATIAGKVDTSTRTSDLVAQDSRDDSQDTALADKVASATRTSDLAAQDSRDDAQEVDIDDLEAWQQLVESSARFPGCDVLADGGFTTIPRWLVNASQTPLNNNAMHMTHFIAPRTATLSKIRIKCGQNSAEGSTATLIRLAVWEVVDDYYDNEPGSRWYVRLATTVSDAAMLNSAWSSPEKTLSPAVSFVEGKEYAWAILVVQASGTTHWVQGSPNIIFEDSVEPRINGAFYDVEGGDLPAGPLKLEAWQANHVGQLYARFLP